MPNATYQARNFGVYLAIPFFKSDITTQDSNADLTHLVAGNTLYCAPRGGSIVAISAVTEAVSAGTITLRAHKNSTEFAENGYPAPALTSAFDNNGTYADVREGALRFVAGDVIGISATGTTDLSPTNTLDVSATLVIVLDPN
jgi:hypothetical protein